jgi:hypothetical protein
VTVGGRPVEATRKSVACRQKKSCPAGDFLTTLSEAFPRIFHSFKANARVLGNDGARPSPPSGTVASPKYLHTFALFQHATMPLWVQNPGNILIKICPSPKNKILLLLHWSLVRPSRGLQPRLETVRVSAIPSYSIWCLLLSQTQEWLKRARDVDLCLAQFSALSSLVSWLVGEQMAVSGRSRRHHPSAIILFRPRTQHRQRPALGNAIAPRRWPERYMDSADIPLTASPGYTNRVVPIHHSRYIQSALRKHA